MDDLFYWLSKTFWLLASPQSLLLILCCFATLMLLRNKLKWAKRSLLLLCTLMLLIAIFPFGQWLLLPLEQRFATNPDLPQKIDGIIVLSGPERPLLSAHWQQPNLSDGAERDLAFMALARRYPKAKLVFTGGGRHQQPQLSQAEVARQLFEQQGLDSGQIIFESKARNTVENVILSHALVKPSKDETWVVITSAFHMPRAIGLFCQQGWPAIPYPVDYRTLPLEAGILHWRFGEHLQQLNLALKEWVGLSAYYLAGKTPSWLPQSCRHENRQK